jgi:hypothetical protein
MSSEPQPSGSCEVEAPVAAVKAKKPMTEVQAANLAKARVKSLENRREAAKLREKEEELKKADMEVRWERVKAEEARLEKEKANAKKLAAVQKKKPKSVILHVSPPMSPRKAEASQQEDEEEEEDSEEEYDASTSRRAHRARPRSPSPPPPKPNPPAQHVPRGPSPEEELRYAMRMLGLR